MNYKLMAITIPFVSVLTALFLIVYSSNSCTPVNIGQLKYYSNPFIPVADHRLDRL